MTRTVFLESAAWHRAYQRGWTIHECDLILTIARRLYA